MPKDRNQRNLMPKDRKQDNLNAADVRREKLKSCKTETEDFLILELKTNSIHDKSLLTISFITKNFKFLPYNFEIITVLKTKLTHFHLNNKNQKPCEKKKCWE